MSGHVAKLDDLVVLAGQTGSNVLVARTSYRDAITLAVYGPNGLAETATVQGSDTEDGSSGWFNIQSNGADLTVGANKVAEVDPVYKAIRILLGGAAAAQRTFAVTKQFWA